MHLLRTFVKILVFPVMLIVTVVWYLFNLLTKISAIVFRLLSLLFFLVIAVALILGVMPWHEAPKNLLVGFIAFVIPAFAKNVAGILCVVRKGLTEYILHCFQNEQKIRCSFFSRT